MTTGAIALALVLGACSSGSAPADDAPAASPVASTAQTTAEDTMPATPITGPSDPDGTANVPPTDPATSEAPSTTIERPDGPSASMSEPLTGGNGVFMGEPLTTDLGAAGYVEREYAASGTATSYTSGERTTDGRWTFTPADEAPYTTRVLVRTPGDPDDFSGTVVVEWLNVSGGADANPEWAGIHEEVIREGHAWVGVSAQLIGVMGGPVLVRTDSPGSENAGLGLRAIDPARYGTLDHPGDGFAFDIYTQVARAIRGGGGMDGLDPDVVIAAGESQSAFALVTYYNGVQPLTEAFDGFFVHSRGGVAMALVGPGESADLAGAIGGGGSTVFRDDQQAPVLNLQTEGDVTGILGSYAARQPDHDRFRLWEVAGTAHFDQHLLGASADYIDCGYPINNGALDVVAKAALRALVTWITTAAPPPEAPRIELSVDAQPVIQRDSDGNALGGIRTPPVDAPVAALSGEPGPDAALACILFGTTTAFTPERLAELYPSRADYEERYAASADVVIEQGFVLADDRDRLLAYSDPDAVAP
ncbi:MAG: alpha/beta hydrolase domain-containing protein [Ilumatobacteraceae bacterium]